jgi:hypothetical protein
MMSIEQRQLLMAVHGVGRVIDIEGNCLWWAPVAPTPQIHHRLRQPYQGAQIWRVLPARQSGLRGQVITALRQAPAGQLECRVRAQIVPVIAIRIAAGNREDARTQNVAQRVGDVGRITIVRDDRRKRIDQANLPVSTG